MHCDVDSAINGMVVSCSIGCSPFHDMLLIDAAFCNTVLLYILEVFLELRAKIERNLL